MAPSPFFRLFAFVFAVQFLRAATADPQEACSYTQHPDLCVQSLLSFPESRTADNHQLAGLAIRYAANYGEEASAFIAALSSDLASNNNNSGPQQCLNDCLEHYIEAVEQLDISIAALEKEAYDDLHDLMMAAMMDATSCNEGCEDEMEKGGEEAAKVKKKTDEFLDLCSVALELNKLITQNDQKQQM